MSEAIKIQRLNYYKGQVLTAQDFNDQQNYHRNKLDLILKRFPSGIIEGLDVTEDKSDHTITIAPGLALDNNRKQLFVGDEGITLAPDEIPVTETDNNDDN